MEKIFWIGLSQIKHLAVEFAVKIPEIFLYVLLFKMLSMSLIVIVSVMHSLRQGKKPIL